jgi:bla regulator protein blaR1
MNRRQLLMITAGSFVLKGQEFEAASIKPSAPAALGNIRVGMQMMPGGRISMSGVTVKLLIQQAYGVKDFQIVGGPPWLGSERYDITAKPEAAATDDQVKVMIQSLLKDRFQLQFHRETKELPTYALVVAKGGPKLKESEGAGGSGQGRGGQMRMMGRGHVEATGVPLSNLATQLANALGRSVIDKTGLQGDYDYKLDWTPDEAQGGPMRGPGGESAAPADNPGVSLFTAVQDQLGLKLESTKGPVEILVIERAEKASEN